MVAIAVPVMMALCLSDCEADKVPVTLNHAIKKQFRQAESLGQLESIPAQSVLFTTKADWNAFWKKFAISPPKIDFGTTNVVAVFAGRKPSSGHSVEIGGIVLDPRLKELHIEILESEPSPDVGTLSVLTFPFDIATFAIPGEWKTFKIVRKEPHAKP